MPGKLSNFQFPQVCFSTLLPTLLRCGVKIQFLWLYMSTKIITCYRKGGCRFVISLLNFCQNLNVKLDAQGFYAVEQKCGCILVDYRITITCFQVACQVIVALLHRPMSIYIYIYKQCCSGEMLVFLASACVS